MTPPVSSFIDRLKSAAISAAVIGLLTAILLFVGSTLFGDLSNLTSAGLSAIAGLVMSFAIEKLPVFSKWFDLLAADSKTWSVYGGVAGVAIALFALSCAGNLGAGLAVACTSAGALGLIGLLIPAFLTSQAAYTAKAKPKAEATKA